MKTRTKRCVLFLFLIASCAILPSCTPTHVYLAADRATFDAVAPEYRAYVEADAALSAEQKQRRFRTVDTWQSRVEAAEGTVK